MRRSFEIASSVKPKPANLPGPPLEVTLGGGLIARRLLPFLIMRNPSQVRSFKLRMIRGRIMNQGGGGVAMDSGVDSRPNRWRSSTGVRAEPLWPSLFDALQGP